MRLWAAAVGGGVGDCGDWGRRLGGSAVEKMLWLVLGAIVIVASLRADRCSGARLVARVALGVLFVVFGALVNLVYLVTDPESFAAFGRMSQFAFVRETWASVVDPNAGLLIGVLIVGEATAGRLILSRGAAPSRRAWSVLLGGSTSDCCSSGGGCGCMRCRCLVRSPCCCAPSEDTSHTRPGRAVRMRSAG